MTDEMQLLFKTGTVMILCGLVVLLIPRVLGKIRYLNFGSALRRLLRLTGFLLIVFGTLAMSTTLHVAGFVLWLMTLVVLAMAVTTHRMNKQNMALWSFSMATQRHVPLPAAAWSLAVSEADVKYSSEALTARALEGGMSLSKALKFSDHKPVREVRALIAAGEESDALAPALEEAVRYTSVQQPLWKSNMGRFLYLLLILILFQLGMSFVIIKIMPAVSNIFFQFEMELPEITQYLVKATELLAGGGALAPFLIITVLALVYCVLRYMGWIRWDIPGFRQGTRTRHASTVLRCLAMATDAGRPISAALPSLAKDYPSAGVKRRLWRAAEAVQRGKPWLDAMQSVGLVKPQQATLLDAAQRVGNLPWALRETADGLLRRYQYRVQAFTQLFTTVILLLMGVVGFVFALGMFMPLITLTTSI